MLAERIAVKPETGIYRRFDALNARHLLYLQAELCILETSLQEQETADSHNRCEKRREFATDYQTMLERPSDEQKLQLALIEEMHRKLNQYNKALIQVSILQRLEEPDRYDLDDIQRFLVSKDIEPGFLTGEDSRSWGIPEEPDDHPPDLVGVRQRTKEDGFSRFVSENAIHLFKCGLGRLKRKDPHLGRRVYYDSTVLRVTSWMTCILASMLPIASILVLINLKALNTKLWVVAGFNVLISVCLKMFTDAKRAEIFAVTAA
ncbi:phthalate transporter [Pyrenophora seminiperda CCB06]|uniref:Phthalate transporter n=1 Tax=Pyrenophora seminiperda CCB06 TaxID=1302712 RepID=A0A3M7LZK1_9PLEO|nr:phthalate transporter [Pyrenophora seminiperda CCB06]